MPRPAKGSEEAKAWGAKMKSAREAKKKMKGGMMGEESDDELAELTANMTMKDDDKPSSSEATFGSRPSAVPPQLKKPVIIKRDLPTFDKIKTEPKKRVADTQITKGKGILKKMTRKQGVKVIAEALSTNLKKNGPIIIGIIKKIMAEGKGKIKGGSTIFDGDFSFESNPVFYIALISIGIRVIFENGNNIINIGDNLINYINNLMAIPGERPDRDNIMEALDDILDGVMPGINNRVGQILNSSGRGIKMRGGSIVEPTALEALGMVVGVLGGVTGIIKLGRMIEDFIKTRQQVVPEAIVEMLGTVIAEQVNSQDDIEEGLPTAEQMISPVEPAIGVDAFYSDMMSGVGMKGGKIKIGKAFKKIGKSFDKAGKDLTGALGKAGTAVNPMTYALGNKKISKLMRQSGQLTNNYLLPAAVSAGLPLYYGAAGTAGMMVGGPLGALAATKAADTLWQEAVVKKGYDPRERQKSKVLGAISEKVGQAGASQFKAGMSSGKEKKVSGGRITLAEYNRRLDEQKVNKAKRMEMAGKGYYLSPGMTVAQPTNKRNLKGISKGGSFSSTILDLMPR